MKFYIAGLPIRIIAEFSAWSEEQVDRIIRRYVLRLRPRRRFGSSTRPVGRRNEWPTWLSANTANC